MRLVVNVAELRRRVGERRTVETEVRLDDAEVGPVRVSPDDDVAVSLELESVAGGISVTGTLHGRWTGECRRCLEPVGGELDVVVDEVFEDRPTEGETYPIEHDAVDLAPLVRESAVLALPAGPLCREDCPGPLPERFPVTVADPDAPPAPDPRWAALDQLRDSDPPAPLR